VVDAWKEQIHTGHIENVVQDLLVLHYDPTYAASMVRNFTQSGQATPCIAKDRQPNSLRQLAKVLCESNVA
jgi:hypothetical protein